MISSEEMENLRLGGINRRKNTGHGGLT
jgi:hypothetical protein